LVKIIPVVYILSKARLVIEKIAGVFGIEGNEKFIPPPLPH